MTRQRLATQQKLAEAVRDCRIMAQQEKSFDHIREVLGWRPERLLEICLLHGISPSGMPSTGGARAAAKAGIDRRERKSLDEARLMTVAVSTTAAVRAAIESEARRRQISKSQFLHEILAAVTRHDLWAEVLTRGEAPP